jgi:hypothetical protein
MTDPSEVVVTREQAAAFNKAMDDAFKTGTDFIGALRICLARFVAERVPDALIGECGGEDIASGHNACRDAVPKGGV